MLKKHKQFASTDVPVGAVADNTVDPDAISPETGKPFSKLTVFRFLAAFVIYAVLNNAAFTINGANLLPQHLKDVGMANPTAAFGIITSVTSLVSLFAGYIWGTMSDRTRSRFGKRTPWIFWGSIVAGIGLYLLGSFQTTLNLTLAYCFNTLGQNAIQTPMYAFMADRVPKNVRGTLSAGLGATSIGLPIGQFISSYFLGRPYQNIGFIVGGVLIALSGLLALAIIPRERSSKDAEIRQDKTIKDVLVTLLPPKMAGAHDFYKSCAGRFLIMTSYTMVMQYLLYILENYIGQSTIDAAKSMNRLSMFTLVVSLVGLVISGPMSDYIKRRKVPVVTGGILMIVGTLIPLFVKSTNGVIAYAIFAGLGYGVYLAVDGALNMDVIPEQAKIDKNTGKYIGFSNLTNTLGLTAAPMATSMIVTATGSYVLAFVGSIAATIIGIFFILTIKHVK
ncbi:MFS transporter [Lentilactobacillus parafarraginis]|uniref:Transporter, major facilitator family protein n=2 Tax=Lentilactobacillus parafarraginis TaxID=390842 RepID=A0A0R1YQ59_9LACO|nr:MFS transporter [Lentilactobacillus parafarraginis]KRM44608.1 transporter, major facilitator family protein [Lentilactobacillus parafarraginis DSM 18390 = JCM 14109]TLQ18424.1 MFS transporter [Lentilactobacillus parafarraginis]